MSLFFICPGYLALATWGGELYSDKVRADIWCEWKRDAIGKPVGTLLATRSADPHERWACSLTCDRNGRVTTLLYITMFSDDGEILYRYDGAGFIFEAIKGAEIVAHIGGGR